MSNTLVVLFSRDSHLLVESLSQLYWTPVWKVTQPEFWRRVWYENDIGHCCGHCCGCCSFVWRRRARDILRNCRSIYCRSNALKIATDLHCVVGWGMSTEWPTLAQSSPTSVARLYEALCWPLLEWWPVTVCLVQGSRASWRRLRPWTGSRIEQVEAAAWICRPCVHVWSELRSGLSRTGSVRTCPLSNNLANKMMRFRRIAGCDMLPCSVW